MIIAIMIGIVIIVSAAVAEIMAYSQGHEQPTSHQDLGAHQSLTGTDYYAGARPVIGTNVDSGTGVSHVESGCCENTVIDGPSQMSGNHQFRFQGVG